MERPCILPALLRLENYCIDLSSSKLFSKHCDKNEEEGIPRDLQNLDQIERKRGMLSP